MSCGSKESLRFIVLSLAASISLVTMIEPSWGGDSLEERFENRASEGLPASAPRSLARHAPDRLIVRLEPRPVGADRIELPGIAELRRLLPISKHRPDRPEIDGPHQIYRARTLPGLDLAALAARLTRRPDVRYAEVDAIVTLFDTLPNDPEFPPMWGLDNTTQTGGVADADIDAPAAWDLTTGSTAAVIAVIDTGIDFNHIDLIDNLWVNPGEVPGDGIDNDLNGYVDDVHGYDIRHDDSNPSDSHSHGTHVSGTIAAVGNNAIGTTGIAWTARVMALRTFGYAGSGSTSDNVEAFYYALDHGARILSNSWGSISASSALRDAVSDAAAADVLVVAAAGNDARNNDVLPIYPASFDFDNVIAVAATDDDDGLAIFSNSGARLVDLGAPGVSIRSSVPPYVDLFFENFESVTPPDLGTAFTLTGTNNLWGTIPGLNGNTVARGDGGASEPYSSDADGWLETAAIDTVGSNGVSLSFDFRYESHSFSDALIVEVWNGNSWQQLRHLSGPENFSTNLSTAKIDLDPHQNAQLQVRFGWVTDAVENDFYGAEIDNIRIRHIGPDYSVVSSTVANFSGTSMATPHVSGVAALLLALDPAMPAEELRQRIIWSGDPIAALEGTTRSGLRLNAFGALTAGFSVALPRGGAVWITGTSRTIEWIPEGGGTVDLFLIASGAAPLLIADDIPNCGRFSWAVPEGTVPGTQYSIRAESASLLAESDPFTISDPRVWFVDASATGGSTGTSWIDAFVDLESALSTALAGDEVWVAAGVYLPSERVTRHLSRSVAFRLRPGVSMYGGFAGTETLREERSPLLNPTILSADLLGDDTSGGDATENAYHVAVGEAQAPSLSLLDGFSLERGNANGDLFETARGGGIFSIYGSLRLNDCSFSSNFGETGGAVASIVNDGDALISCAFSGNEAADGGAISFEQTTNARLESCTFNGNDAVSGGALRLSTSTAHILDAYFTLNDAAIGGAISARSGSVIDGIGATLRANGATSGGGIEANDAEIELVNCEFHENSASVSGGAVALSQGASLVGSQCTLASNVAPTGSAIDQLGSSTELANSIVWGNGSVPLSGSPGTITVSASCVEGGFTGSGNISIDPLFVDEPGGDLRLSDGSPAVDGGNNLLVPADAFDLDGDGDVAEPLPFDRDGAARVVSVSVDMGAFERQIGVTPEFIRGDCNSDQVFNIADPIAHLGALFSGGTPPPCNDACDTNDDGAVDIADPISSLAALFAGGTPPAAPFPACGQDPSFDAIGCNAGGCP